MISQICLARYFSKYGPYHSKHEKQHPDAAFHALNDKDHILKSIELNKSERSRVFNKLTKLGFECIPSQGNFISFKGNFDAEVIFIELMKLAS